MADLATIERVDKLYATIGGRPVGTLLANTGRGLGRGFLDQDFDAVRHVVDTDITGTIHLLQEVGRDVDARPGVHPHHRLHHRVHAGRLPSGVERHQGAPRIVLVSAAPRTEEQRRQRHLPDTRRHRD